MRRNTEVSRFLQKGHWKLKNKNVSHNYPAIWGNYETVRGNYETATFLLFLSSCRKFFR